MLVSFYSCVRKYYICWALYLPIPCRIFVSLISLMLRLILTATHYSYLYTQMDKLNLTPTLAALTLARICPVVPLSERPSEKKHFLIYSRKQVTSPNNTPIEWIMEAHNQAVYGNITAPGKLALGAITGYIETRGDSLSEPSIWSKGLLGELCRVSYARILDRPIYIPEYALRDWYISDEALCELPCHYLHDLYRPWEIGDALEVPLCKDLFDNVPDIGVLKLDLCGMLKELVLDENGNLRKFSSLNLTSGNRNKSVKFCADIYTETDSNGNPVLYPSVYDDMATRRRLRLFL